MVIYTLAQMIRAVLEIYETAEAILAVNLLAVLCDWGSIEKTMAQVRDDWEFWG